MKKTIIFIILQIMFYLNVHAPQNDYSFPKSWRTHYDKVLHRKNILREQDFSYENLKDYIYLNYRTNKKIILSQAILETGFFTSDIFIENNNLFGMKEPRVRPTKALGSNRGHATYNHWTCSVDDYVLWYQYMTRNKSYTNYFSFLNSIGYAEDGDYIFKLKTIITMIDSDLFVYNKN